MKRVFNFSAGPAALPLPVLEQVQQELLTWNHTGASVMEVSHRGEAFVSMAHQAEADLRELLLIPDSYAVLFLQGGATIQFSAVPLNLMQNGRADYALTGHWSKKAVAEAQRYGEVSLACDTSAEGFKSVPLADTWKLDDKADYLHITPNETIAGVEFEWLPTTKAPIVADLSSTILSRPIDVSRYGVIYAGAQKNIGPAGITVVIVRRDLMGKSLQKTPNLLDYQVMADSESMSNTPPTFAWYLAGKVFAWLKGEGGVAAIHEKNKLKAQRLYDCIDNSSGFYTNPVEKAHRSLMNIPFILADSNLDQLFLQQSHQQGLHALKGHRSVGGMRASIYNAMGLAGVDALIDFMQQFQRQYG